MLDKDFIGNLSKALLGKMGDDFIFAFFALFIFQIIWDNQLQIYIQCDKIHDFT